MSSQRILKYGLSTSLIKSHSSFVTSSLKWFLRASIEVLESWKGKLKNSISKNNIKLISCFTIETSWSFSVNYLPANKFPEPLILIATPPKIKKQTNVIIFCLKIIFMFKILIPVSLRANGILFLLDSMDSTTPILSLVSLKTQTGVPGFNTPLSTSTPIMIGSALLKNWSILI